MLCRCSKKNAKKIQKHIRKQPKDTERVLCLFAEVGNYDYILSEKYINFWGYARMKSNSVLVCFSKKISFK